MARVNSVRRRLSSECGAELIETALTLPLILLVVIGIIEFGFVFQKYEVITNAAREGARVYVLPNFDADDAEARVNQYLDAAGLDSSLANVPTPAAPAAVDLNGVCMTTVTVTVSYPHAAPFLTGIMRYFGSTLGNFTLNASSTMRTEQPAAACP